VACKQTVQGGSQLPFEDSDGVEVQGGKPVIKEPGKARGPIFSGLVAIKKAARMRWRRGLKRSAVDKVTHVSTG
jgi:hypothetical protein